MSKKPFVILKAGEIIGLKWLNKPANHKTRNYVDFADFFKKLLELGPHDEDDYQTYLEKLQDMAHEMLVKSPPPLEGLPYIEELRKKGINIYWE